MSNSLPPLLITNLRIPLLHGELISRNLLMERLDRALDFPLTLVSAPAGFGKTTLLSQWIAKNKNEGLQNRAAWVSLESDCDAVQFWRYVMTALEGLQPGMGQPLLASLDTTHSPVNTILRVLINEINAINEDLLLVLDDYDHVEDSLIHTTLTFLIDHLPSNMHLVIASRSYPLLPFARWRAGSKLYELREEDLRFTPEEIAIFFNEIKGLALSVEEIEALRMRTEGWVAGLQLLALSLQDSDEESKRRFVFDFTGSQRYILDYLIEEVLHQQPGNIRDFLLQTSVLDRLNASLCNAVTGRNDGQVVLEYLVRSHLFTIPLDQEGNWYRYHPLFLDVLRHRLQQKQPDFVFELHRRASAWHTSSGQTDEAIRHATAAQEWGQAIALIEPAISSAWNRGEIRKIITWLGKLPVIYLNANPHLSLYYSRALLLGGQLYAAEGRLRESEKSLRARLGDIADVENRLLLGTICAFRTTVAAVSGETASALALGGEALSLLPPENFDIRAHVVNSLGVNDYYRGDMDEAARACAEAGSLAHRAGNLYLAMVAATYRAKALICRGQLKQAGHILEQALDQGRIPEMPVGSWIPAVSVICSRYGILLYEWNRLEEAERTLTEGIDLGQRLAYGSALWYSYHALARVKLARGDLADAESLVEQAQRYRMTYTVPLPTRLMDAEQARANLALSQMDAAERWAAALHPDRPASLGFVQEVEEMTLARLYLSKNLPEQALDLLDRILLAAASSGRRGHVIEILVLTALAQHALGELRLATSTLLSVLRMAETEGYLRTFVDEGQPVAALLYGALARGVFPGYAGRLLAIFQGEERITGSSPDRFASPRATPVSDHPIEPLSQRELEVLRLIAAGASNQEIAGELTITVTTTKKHVSNIIHKLGVGNRTQAAAKGRQLNLC